MISGNAGLKRRKDKNLSVRRDAPDGPTTITDIKIARLIECDSRGDAHPFGICAECAVGSYAVHSAVIARGNIKLPLRIKSHACGVHQFGKKRLYVVVGVDLVNGDGHFVVTSTGIRGVNVACTVTG